MPSLLRRVVARALALVYAAGAGTFAVLAPARAGAPPPPAHEESDASVAGVLAVGIALLCALALAAVLVSWLYATFTGEPLALHPPHAGLDDVPRPAPLPIAPTAAELHAAERRVLGSYGWVDRARGLVRLPIERAMDVLAARGLPARAGPPPPREPFASGAASGRFVEPPAP